LKILKGNGRQFFVPALGSRNRGLPPCAREQWRTNGKDPRRSFV